MKERRKRHQSPRLVALVALLVAAGIAYADEPAPEAPAPETPEAASQRPALGAGGQRAYIDPQTKALTLPPRKHRVELSSRLQEMFSTSHEGLEVILSPGGFSYVHLEGRFHNATLATVGEDGEVRIHHGLPVEKAEPVTAAEKEQP